jgi:beta-glucosidase/6-phospho-beta-glucosidase/beta-galactosidase
MTRIPIIGGFESTYQPLHDVDVMETTGHVHRWRDDLRLLRACGVVDVRYPIRWHRVERLPGRFDWDATDRVMAFMHETGLRPIADLVHHTSYPWWLGGFANRRFHDALLRYVEAFARRYPEVTAYTVFNEPFTTLLLCGQQGIWPPYWRGIAGFVRLACNVMPALTEATRLMRQLVPHARHVHVEVCERASSAGTAAGDAYAAFANDRRFFLTDLMVGRPHDPRSPFVAAVLAAGGEELLSVPAGHIDVLGLDYYAHNQWLWRGWADGTPHAPEPAPLAELIAEYGARYGLPMVIGETNVRGTPSDRATWLKYVLEQCEIAAVRGAAIEGLCWFPFVDSCDWDSILCRADGNIDPVGAVCLEADRTRRRMSMFDSYRRAAVGEPAASLPAYRLQPPVSSWLRGWEPQMRHWTWEDAPAHERAKMEPDAADLELELRVVERHG